MITVTVLDIQPHPDGPLLGQRLGGWPLRYSVDRCRVIDCGNAGTCDGVGTEQYPCPRKETP